MRRPFVSTVAGIALVGATVILSAQTNVLTVKPDDETRKLLRDTTQDKWFKRDVLLPALFGGFLAAAAGVWVACYTHRLEVRQKQLEDARFTENVLRAIRRELEVLREIYDKNIGADLSKVVDGQILEIRFLLTEDWLTVFTSSAAHLGKIDGKLSQRIITTYMLLKGLVEEYRINNDLLTQRQQIIVQHYFNPGNPQDIQARDKCYQWLIGQAVKLKQADAALKVAVDELFALFEEHGIK